MPRSRRRSPTSTRSANTRWRTATATACSSTRRSSSARPGKRDGLIWSQTLGDDSPLGEGFLPKKPGDGYHGYHFRILTAQGPAAKGGARSFLIGRDMTAGYALVAWPVKYGETGVMSFIVNSDGVVYERDLGRGTAQAAAAVKTFNPEAGWAPVRP